MNQAPQRTINNKIVLDEIKQNYSPLSEKAIVYLH